MLNVASKVLLFATIFLAQSVYAQPTRYETEQWLSEKITSYTDCSELKEGANYYCISSISFSGCTTTLHGQYIASLDLDPPQRWVANVRFSFNPAEIARVTATPDLPDAFILNFDYDAVEREGSEERQDFFWLRIDTRAEQSLGARMKTAFLRLRDIAIEENCAPRAEAF